MTGMEYNFLKWDFPRFFPFDLCDQVRSEQDWPPGGNVWHLLCHALWSNFICKGGKENISFENLRFGDKSEREINGWIFSLGERRRSFPVTRMTSVNWVKGKRWSYDMILETKKMNDRTKTTGRDSPTQTSGSWTPSTTARATPRSHPVNHYKGIVSPSNGIPKECPHNKWLDRWEAQDP